MYVALTKKIVLVIYFINLVNCIFCQNLVKNPSFETTSSIKSSELEAISGWELSYFSANIFSAYNECGEEEKHCTSVPYNYNGFQYARTGSNYAGIFILKEALQTRLIDSLQKDSLYYIEYYVSLADSSDCTIWQLGAAFTKEPLKYNSLHTEVIKCNPQVYNTANRFIPFGKKWMKICGTYKATGREQYLIISGFVSPAYEIRKYKEPDSRNRLYIYFDDVLVKKVPVEFEIYSLDTCIQEKGETIVLENLLFEFGKAQLIEESKPELLKLVSFLKEYPQINVKICGHSDEVGNESFNIELSKNRANTVKTYLVENGIMLERIETFGYGSSKPIVSTKFREQQQVNRRVEIVIN